MLRAPPHAPARVAAEALKHPMHIVVTFDHGASLSAGSAAGAGFPERGLLHPSMRGSCGAREAPAGAAAAAPPQQHVRRRWGRRHRTGMSHTSYSAGHAPLHAGAVRGPRTQITAPVWQVWCESGVRSHQSFEHVRMLMSVSTVRAQDWVQDMESIPICSSSTQRPGCLLQILQRAPRMADFRMASSRVGAEGGIALARALCAGQHLPAPQC